MEWAAPPEQGWREPARHSVVDREDVQRSNNHTSELLSDETDKGPPLQTHTLRKFEQHLNDLKKENFSLKLRIYFLEERIQQKYEDSTEDVHRRNIELKVEVESLKQELQEKQEQLDNALTTVENLSSQNEAELQQRWEERQREIDHMQEILQTKIQLLQEEAKLAHSEADKMATIAECQSQQCLALERKMKEVQEEGKMPLRPTQQNVLTEKDRYGC
ncbi:myomegalin-like [Arapaima gigas]